MIVAQQNRGMSRKVVGEEESRIRSGEFQMLSWRIYHSTIPPFQFDVDCAKRSQFGRSLKCEVKNEAKRQEAAASSR